MTKSGCSEILSEASGVDWWSSRFGRRGILQLALGDDALFPVVLIAAYAMADVIMAKEHYEILGVFMEFLFFAVGMDVILKIAGFVAAWLRGHRSA